MFFFRGVAHQWLCRYGSNSRNQKTTRSDLLFSPIWWKAEPKQADWQLGSLWNQYLLVRHRHRCTRKLKPESRSKRVGYLLVRRRRRCTRKLKPESRNNENRGSDAAPKRQRSNQRSYTNQLLLAREPDAVRKLCTKELNKGLQPLRKPEATEWLMVRSGVREREENTANQRLCARKQRK